MATITGKTTLQNARLSATVKAGLFGNASYTQLTDLPKLNGVVIKGSRTGDDYSVPTIKFDTTENWKASGEVSEEHVIYVFTDYKEDPDGNAIAGIKLGDGKAYIIDLPFLDSIAAAHAADTDIHITAEEREYWNNKNRAYAYGETVILTTER